MLRRDVNQLELQVIQVGVRRVRAHAGGAAEDQLRPLLGALGVAPVGRDELGDINVHERVHGPREALVGHRDGDAERGQLGNVLLGRDQQVARGDEVVLRLQVDEPVVHRVGRRARLLRQRDLSLVDELEVAALARLLHQHVSQVVLVAQRARRARQVRVRHVRERVLLVRVVVLDVVHEDTHGVRARVAQVQEVRADLEHLLHVEVRRDGQVLREHHAVHELHGGEDRRALLVGLDLLHGRHEAGGARGEHALQGAQAVLGVVLHGPARLDLLQDEVQQVVLEVDRRREGAHAHAHHLPSLGDRLRLRVGTQLLHDLAVDLVPERNVLQPLLQNVLRQRGGEGHLLVAHVA
mmetsp:Transcript_3092/g.12432  ORF Transcript_3092/g.12432 Transcript_3092/m.12432 type:complete len:352 (-) Transcript_3092:2247-3302(-)